jgi:hypothetical protein
MDISELKPIERVQAIEDYIKEQPQIDIPVNHYFAGGVYEREMLAPANSMFTGKIHLTEHIAKLVSGTMTITDGDTAGTFTGPKTFISKPGDKRAGIAHTDCVFSTFHAIDEQPIDDIEKQLVVDTIEQYQIEQQKMRGLK